MGKPSKIDGMELKRLLQEDVKPGRIRRICAHFGVKREALYNAIKREGLEARPSVLGTVSVQQIEKLFEEDSLVRGSAGRYKRIAEILKVDIDIIRQAGRQINSRKSLARQREIHGCLLKTKNYRKDPRINLCREALHRAIHKGLDFDLHPSDISVPEVCPVLGIPVAVGSGRFSPNSPNLDRIDSSKGYTWDNVMVISSRANSIKTNATPEELRKVADFYDSYQPPTTRNPIEKIKPSTQYKVTEEQKQEIRKAFSEGMDVKEVACTYDISYRLAWELTR